MENQQKLMQEAINQAYQHAGELRSMCAQAGDQFRGGQNDGGMESLRHVLNGVGCIAQAIHVTAPFQKSRGIEMDLTALPGMLEPLVEALENRDFVMLSELVTYEMEPILEGWHQKLGELSTTSDQSPQA